jgi:hypothetical protein
VIDVEWPQSVRPDQAGTLRLAGYLTYMRVRAPGAKNAVVKCTLDADATASGGWRVGAALSPGSRVVGAASGALIAALLVGAALAGALTALAGAPCADGPVAAQAPPSASADRGIPADYLALYQAAGRSFDVPWTVLAGIGAIETDHGRSSAPGVHSGLNAYGCCAGPMQFNLTDGSPSTWQRYRIDGDADGVLDPYDPADAIASAAHYLRTLLRAAGGDVAEAIGGYNHSAAYVADVLAHARAYGGESAAQLTAPARAAEPLIGDCDGAPGDAAGAADLTTSIRVSEPRAYRTLPAWAMAPGHAPEPVDARLYDDVTWILRRYHLRVTAARAAGHMTHGDGTAVDLIPADGASQAAWNASAGRLAADLGWTPACGASGSRPACDLVPAIQFIGYDGYPGHGSPRTCTRGCPVHIHISWVSPCFGASALAAPCESVSAFPVPTGGPAD